MQRQRRETAPERGGETLRVDLKVWRKLQEMTGTWGEDFKSEKQKRVIWSSKHTFVSLNLMIYCTLSVSMLTFQLFLNILPISGRKHSFPPF